MNGLRRWLLHLWLGPMHVRRAFPREAFERIERAIAEGERGHRAEVRFAVESSLHAAQLWRRTPARERALQVFSEFRIWDTEENNGVLVYLLWADHAVEVIADRGATARVDPAVWALACSKLVDASRSGRQVEGAIEAIATISAALATAYPADGGDNPDELPNAPLMLG